MSHPDPNGGEPRIDVRSTRLQTRTAPGQAPEQGVELAAHAGRRLLATGWVDLTARVAELRARALAVLNREED